MHVAQVVLDSITSRRPAAICDACIARAAGIRHQQASRITIALGTTSQFDRASDICVDCGKDQKVIRRLRPDA